MMYAVKINDRWQPITVADLMLRHPDTSFPETITAEVAEAFNLREWTMQQRPYHDPDKEFTWWKLEEQDDGQLMQTWIRQKYTKEEMERRTTDKAAEVRQERNSRLADVDSLNPMRWEEFNDEQKAAWRTYRKALLDITQQEEFPWNVEWPKRP